MPLIFPRFFFLPTHYSRTYHTSSNTHARLRTRLTPNRCAAETAPGVIPPTLLTVPTDPFPSALGKHFALSPTWHSLTFRHLLTSTGVPFAFCLVNFLALSLIFFGQSPTILRALVRVEPADSFSLLGRKRSPIAHIGVESGDFFSFYARLILAVHFHLNRYCGTRRRQ